MTDPGTADRTYIGPMTPELVEQILDKVSVPSMLMRCYLPAGETLGAYFYPAGCAVIYLFLVHIQERPDAILPTMGGQTALNLAKALAEVCTPCTANRLREHWCAILQQHVCSALRPLPALLLAVSCFSDMLV